jgi:UDP-galactopyranose mutase
MKTSHSPDLVVFSHLRWDFVFQRPQHLLTRSGGDRRVLFIEEPVFEHDIPPRILIGHRPNGVDVAVPHLRIGVGEMEMTSQLTHLINDLVRDHVSRDYIAWYYTPMALKFTRQLKPIATVYDCMDELSQFKLCTA